MDIGTFDPWIFPEGEETDGKYTIPLQIYRDDLCKIWRYEILFRNCIVKGYRLRPSVLKNYFDLLKSVPRDNFKNRKEYVESIKLKILAKLRGTAYDFNIENTERLISASLFVSRIAEDRNILRNYTMAEFLDIYFSRIIHDNSLQKTGIEKSVFFEHAYTELYQYLSKVPDEKQPTFYSYTVIVGYLAAGFGLVVTEEDYPASTGKPLYYTTFLHNIAKYSCQKAKKKLSDERKTAPDKTE